MGNTLARLKGPNIFRGELLYLCSKENIHKQVTEFFIAVLATKEFLRPSIKWLWHGNDKGLLNIRFSTDLITCYC